jgi:hypothetical protein
MAHQPKTAIKCLSIAAGQIIVLQRVTLLIWLQTDLLHQSQYLPTRMAILQALALFQSIKAAQQLQQHQTLALI